VGNKQSLSSGFLKRALSNEEPSHPMHHNYLFQTAFEIIFTLKPTSWHWTKIAKTFSVKNGQYSPKFGNSIPKQTIIMPAHRGKSLHILASHHR
jgi:hypothetical protein